MIGIILISHGEMAEGMLATGEIFFGELQQVEAVALNTDDNPEDFRVRVSDAIQRVDSGDGVVVLTDILGGTTSNQTAYLACDKVQVISGMNLSIFLELLAQRLNGIVEIEQLINSGKDGIVHINQMLNKGL